MRPTRPENNRIANEHEPAAIRGISKKKLHEMLCDEYFLPGNDSRGITRDYLVGVYTNVHFRIPLLEIKHFQADLTPGQLKKAPVLYCGQLVTKINRILEETHRRPLGFPPGVIPEEDWLVAVTRFVDRSNCLGIFLDAIPGAPLLECETQRMIIAKRNAEDFVLGNDQLLLNNKIFKDVTGIHDHSKRVAGHRQELQALFDQGAALERKLAIEEADLNDKLYKAAVSVYSHGRHINDPADIFVEGNEVGMQHRLQIQDLIQYLKFIYISDPATDRSELSRRLCVHFLDPNNLRAPPNPQNPPPQGQ